MPSGTIKRIGPLALTNTYTTNVYNNSSALIYDVLRAIIVTNKTAGAVSFRLYIGATGANAAGTELFFDQSVPADTEMVFNFPGGLKLASTDFLVGGASAATSLTITGITEQFAV